MSVYGRKGVFAADDGTYRYAVYKVEKLLAKEGEFKGLKGIMNLIRFSTY